MIYLQNTATTEVSAKPGEVHTPRKPPIDDREALDVFIRGPPMPPVLGGVVIERSQLRPVAVELCQGLGVRGAVLLAEHLQRRLASLRAGASMSSFRSPFARDCSRLDSASMMFPAA